MSDMLPTSQKSRIRRSTKVKQLAGWTLAADDARQEVRRLRAQANKIAKLARALDFIQTTYAELDGIRGFEIRQAVVSIERQLASGKVPASGSQESLRQMQREQRLQVNECYVELEPEHHLNENGQLQEQDEWLDLEKLCLDEPCTINTTGGRCRIVPITPEIPPAANCEYKLENSR